VGRLPHGEIAWHVLVDNVLVDKAPLKFNGKITRAHFKYLK
jgi:hypothetical protein